MESLFPEDEHTSLKNLVLEPNENSDFSLKITKSQDLLFENVTFPTSEARQNQTKAHQALNFLLLEP